MPDVSVIVPLYNKRPYIQRALASVWAQTGTGEMEVIIVDDGSTDGGPEVVAAMNEPRIHLIHQDNAGPGAARNRGLAEATGDYAVFLDADDEWLPGFLETSLAALRTHPQCACSVCAYHVGPARTIRGPYLPGEERQAGPWRLPVDAGGQILQHTIRWMHSEVILCRRELVVEYGGYYGRHRCTWGEDLWLWLKVMLNRTIYRIPEPLAWWHTEASEIGPGRITTKPPGAILDAPEEIRLLCSPEYRKTLESYLAKTALAAAFRQVTAGDNAMARELLRRFPSARREKEYPALRRQMFLVPVIRLLQRLRSGE